MGKTLNRCSTPSIPSPPITDNSQLTKLQEENTQLKKKISDQEKIILELQVTVRELEKKVKDLNAIIMEQIKVMLETLANLKLNR